MPVSTNKFSYSQSGNAESKKLYDVIIYLNAPRILTLSNDNCELTSWGTTFITDSQLYERFARFCEITIHFREPHVREAISLVIRVVCSVPRALIRLDPERIYRFALGNGVENFYDNRSFRKVSERSSIFLLARQCIMMEQVRTKGFLFMLRLWCFSNFSIC